LQKNEVMGRVTAGKRSKDFFDNRTVNEVFLVGPLKGTLVKKETLGAETTRRTKSLKAYLWGHSLFLGWEKKKIIGTPAKGGAGGSM